MINDFGGLMIEDDTEYLRRRKEDGRDEAQKEIWNKQYIKILKDIVKNRPFENKKDGFYMSIFTKIGVKNPLSL